MESPLGPATQSARALGERLADWLERLDLVDTLGTVGLPTLQRDADGTASWTDPGTGDPLTLDQLEQLDALLHREGDEPAHAVPVELVQVARRARLRAELLASPCHDYESLARLRMATVDATRFAVHKAAAEHRLLVLTPEDRAIVPAFQLGAQGEVRPELEPVLSVLLAAGGDPWRTWIWLTQPAGLLGGLVPERAVADPAEADLVVAAARRLAAVGR